MYEAETVSATSPKGPLAAVLAGVIAIGGLFGYSVHERNVAARLQAQNAELAATLKDTRGEIDNVTAKMNALIEAQQKAQQEAALREQVAHQQSSRMSASRRRAEDAKLKKLQAELQSKIDEQAKAIDATRQDLTSTGNELRGSIARTHDELVVLQRKGERNYYEFDLDKSKNFAKAGPVSVSLRKASTKDRFADLKLIVDDAQLTQKHVNLYQPVMFYAGDSGAPIELVINSVTKNHVHGYISEPKYRAADLASMQKDAAAGTQSVPPARTKLTVPSSNLPNKDKQ